TNLPPGLSIQYGIFNDKWIFSELFISDSKELGQRIEEVNARFGPRGQGHTALYDALHEALSRFHDSQPGDAILLITDGGENSSKLSANKLEREFRDANVRLLTILVQSPSPLGEYRPDWMQQLSQNTAGDSLRIDTASSSWEDRKGLLENARVLRNFWIDRV